MTVIIADGITKVTLTGALVQEFGHEETEEVSETSKMINGAAQVAHLYAHTAKGKGSVKGKGDLTLTCGLNRTIGVSMVSGGVTHVGSVKYMEKLTETAEWEFSYTHYPHAA